MNGVNTDMSKSNVNPSHYKVAGRERQGEDIAQTRNKQKHAENLARQRTEIGARAGKPAPEDAKDSPGRKRGHNLVSGGSGPHARFPSPLRVPALRPAGAAPQLPPKQATKKARVKRQGADKRSTRSAAQQRATSRDDAGVLPVTGAVVGVFGRGRPRRRPQPRT